MDYCVHLGQVSISADSHSFANVDSVMSLNMGRSRAINVSDCTARPPTDCEIPENRSNTRPTPPIQTPFCSTYTIHLYRYDLALKIYDIVSSRINVAGRSTHSTMTQIPGHDKVKVLHDKIVSILDNLPRVLHPEDPDTSWDMRIPELPGNREEVLCLANSVLLALHRPYASIDPSNREEAIKAALKLLDNQQKSFDALREHHYKFYGLSFHTIDAATFLSSITIEHPPDDNAELELICYALQKGISRLSVIGSRSPIAKSGSQILMQYYQKLQESLQTTSGGRAEEQFSGFDGITHETRMPEYPVEYPSPTTFAAHLANQALQSDMSPYGTDFNPSLLDPMGFIGDLGVDQYGNDFNWGRGL